MSDDSTNGEVEPVKLVDRNSDYSRFEGDPHHIIKGLLHNRQLSSPDDTDGDHLASSLKYTREDIPRRDFTDLDDVSGYDVGTAKRILDIFGEDGDQALEFQLNAWDTINAFDENRRETRDHQGIVLSAPTGFGKTYAFMGPIYDKVLNEDEFSTAILVFPRTALLRDQLSRILERQTSVKRSDNYDGTFSVGTWITDLPWTDSEVEDSGKTGISEDEQGRTIFSLADYWDDESDEDELYISGDTTGYEIFNDDVTITDEEFIFPKKAITDNPPDILLTTLESLELFSLKPNWNIIDQVDTIVFDEIHQYNGIRGSHAANIVDNIKTVRDRPLLLLGSSATIENPDQFGRKLFDLQKDSQFESVEPTDNDYAEDADDHRHHYFLLSDEDGPGAASMYIQELMLLGHALLDPQQNGDSGEMAKILSFIDSKSQIHQREDQFQDADENQELWRYHDSDSDRFVAGDQLDDYRRVADQTGHEFLECPIEIYPFHRESDTSISDLDDMEIIQSTSSLEVGIDIEDIEIVTQYREPLSGLSAFVQRAGRAAREEDTDAHIVTMLSSYAGDSNFYHRADRFLNSDIETPLRTDNKVVGDIHGMALDFYEEINEIHSNNPRNWWRPPYEDELLEGLFADRLEADRFHQFLVNTSVPVSDIINLDSNVDNLLTSDNLDAFAAELEQEAARLEDEIEEISRLTQAQSDDLLRGDDPVNSLLDEISSNIQDLVTRYEEQLGDSEEIDDDLADKLETLRSGIRSDTTRDSDERFDLYRHLSGVLTQVAGSVSTVENEVPDISEITELTQLLARIETAVEKGTIERQQRQRKSIYYLRQSTSEIEQYVNADTDSPHGSLYFIKHLFRAAYFFDQCLRLSDNDPVNLNYYPDDYFGGGGKSFTLSSENRHENDRVESIDTIINQYAPFKAQYLSRPGEMHMNVPDMITSGEEPRMNFSNIPGRNEDGIKIPDEITMTAVEDVTGHRSQGVVVYDQDTFHLFQNFDIVPPRTNPRRAKIHSEPHVSTDMEHVGDTEHYQGLSVGDVSARAAIDSVTLEISSVYYHDESDEYRFTGDTEEEHIESTEPRLGFVLDSRGITWNVEEIIASVDNYRAEVEQYKDLDELDLELEEIGLNTAAHFLTLLIADISGVNSGELLHGIDQDNHDEVYVFEQTEGGQGIVDLFFERLQNKPHVVLRSMLRLLYNTQVMNERLWADDTFVDAIQVDDAREDDHVREQVVRDHIDVTFDSVIQRTAEEVLGTLDKVTDVIDECDPDDHGAVYELKHDIAQARLAGHEEIPDEVFAEYPDIVDQVGESRIKELFRSPDIDGCAENLRLKTTLFNAEQGDGLSYVLLEALRETVLQYESAEDYTDELFDREQLWGGEQDGEIIFPTF